jgi:hypothetical protein
VNLERYNMESSAILQIAKDIENAKRGGYTRGDVDVLCNFKAVASRAGLTPEQVWAVYTLKHVDALLSLMTQPDLPVAEAAPGRFADLLNYVKLGYALWKEREAARDQSPA